MHEGDEGRSVHIVEHCMPRYERWIPAAVESGHRCIREYFANAYCESHVWKQIDVKLTPLGGTKLIAYNGNEVKCHGILKLLCQYKDSDSFKYRLYVVEAPGLAVLGLPACERLNIITINSIA